MHHDHEASDRSEHLRRMAAVGFLTRSFGHEFNNVLGTMLGSAHLLAMTNTDPAQQPRLNALVAATRQAIELARSLAALARTHDGAEHELDVHALLGELSQTPAGPGRRRLTLELRADAPRIDAERAALGEALATLAGAVAHDGGEVRVTTANAGEVSARATRAGDAGTAWLLVTLAGDAPPLEEARRHLVMHPLSARPEDAAAVILAGAVAVIGQARGRVLVPDDAATAELRVFLPTVAAPVA